VSWSWKALWKTVTSCRNRNAKAISFTAMTERGLTEALAADHHFEQRTPWHLKPVGDQLYVATAGEGVQFEWRRRDQTLGQRVAHQLGRDAAKGR
jgi:hypothetical protein